MRRPVTLKDMGSFMFGGTVHVAENGETRHGDHGYAQYFVPEKASNWPVIMWHGMGQSGKCWESTPERKDGFLQLALQEDLPVYIIDQNRRGRAGYTYGRWDDSVPHAAVVDYESVLWTTFRAGFWQTPDKASVFPGTQQSLDPDALNQFFRAQCPDVDNEDITEEYRRFQAQNMIRLLEQAGPSILFTHSNSGQYGWYTAALAPEKVKMVIALEPGHFVFPEDYELPYSVSPVQEMVDTLLQPFRIPREEFMNLTKMPIRIIWGDTIRAYEDPSPAFPEEVWRISQYRSHVFADYINSLGGDAKVIELPRLGITGNTHGLMHDKNNVEVWEQILKEMKDAGMTASDCPYQGPVPVKETEIHIPLDI